MNTQSKRPDEETQRILVLLKLDSKRLFERIKDREIEYIAIFSIKRTREHFKDIFRNRYRDIPIEDLKKCGQEVIVGLDNFYSLVEEMQWYLNHTENMPSTVEDHVKVYIKKLSQLYETLSLYIDAELGIDEDSSLHSSTDFNDLEFNETGDEV